MAELARDDLGDTATGRKGKNKRPAGQLRGQDRPPPWQELNALWTAVHRGGAPRKLFARGSPSPIRGHFAIRRSGARVRPANGGFGKIGTAAATRRVDME